MRSSHRTIALGLLAACGILPVGSVEAQERRFANSRVSTSYAPGVEPLECYGRKVPPVVVIDGPFPDLTPKTDPFDLTIPRVTLSYSQAPKNRVEIHRTVQFSIGTGRVAAQYLAGKEKHGCEQELYLRDSWIDASANTLSLHAKVFGAERVCVAPPKGGDHRAVCSAEGERTGTQAFTVELGQTYADCKATTRTDPWFRFNTAPFAWGGSTQSAECLGQKVELLQFLSAALGRPDLLIGLKVAEDKLRLPTPDQFSIAGMAANRVPADRLTLCPDSVALAKSGNNAAELNARDKNEVERPIACRIYRFHIKEWLLRAEELSPTPSIVVDAGEGLWTLADELWSDPYLYPVLARHNGLRPNAKLVPGQTLKVPSISQEMSNAMLVRWGESLWSLSRRLFAGKCTPDQMRRALQRRPVSGDLVYPYDLVVASPCTGAGR